MGNVSTKELSILESSLERYRFQIRWQVLRNLTLMHRILYTTSPANKGEKLILYHTSQFLKDQREKGIWKYCGKKEKMLVTSMFSFSPQYFLTIYWQIPLFELYIYECRLQMLSIWKDLNFFRLLKGTTKLGTMHLTGYFMPVGWCWEVII